MLSGSFDIAALCFLQNSLRRCEVVNVPRLDAKVYVADEACAIVTSANLTPSGLDLNLEYGIGLTDRKQFGTYERICDDTQFSAIV